MNSVLSGAKTFACAPILIRMLNRTAFVHTHDVQKERSDYETSNVIYFRGTADDHFRRAGRRNDYSFCQQC